MPDLKPPAQMAQHRVPGRWRWHGGLLAVWFVTCFGVVFFARDLQITWGGWSIGYWLAAQGSLFVFLAIVVVFAWVMNRQEGRAAPDLAFQAYQRRLHWRFASYVVLLLVLLSLLAYAEQLGLKKTWLGAIFLFVTLGLYVVMGIFIDTTKY
jgi:cation/acetate symporter